MHLIESIFGDLSIDKGSITGAQLGESLYHVNILLTGIEANKNHD